MDKGDLGRTVLGICMFLAGYAGLEYFGVFTESHFIDFGLGGIVGFVAGIAMTVWAYRDEMASKD